MPYLFLDRSDWDTVQKSMDYVGMSQSMWRNIQIGCFSVSLEQLLDSTDCETKKGMIVGSRAISARSRGISKCG